ncbi:glycosyltransferase family 4 protein [Chitinolyticbacter albus]|uniref:glycosyltransferase family 4 protein n=1 Tax=Chitinolyticbacter albus TaxID=2961951 RepID=UPI0021099B41|nr:glycosyltransferase family 4 protein [Chitinolyticbacter albus]
MKARRVLMIGPSPDAQGGMATWAKSAQMAGLFERLEVDYFASHVDAGKLKKLIQAAKAYAYVLYLVICEKTLVVHFHVATGISWWRKWGMIRLLQAFSVPYVLHLHGGTFKEFYTRHQRRLTGRELVRAFEKADAVLALSPDWVEWVGSIAPRARCISVPNAVVIPPSPTASSSFKRCLYLGRISKPKGLEELLIAAQCVLKSHPDFVLELGGVGDEDWARELISRLGIESSVHLLGWLAGQEKESALARCDMLVLPSHKEALPFVILEAMARAKLVIASDVGSIRWVLSDGEAGLLVPARATDELASALTWAMDHAEQAFRLAEAGYMRAQSEFSFDHMEAQLEAIYENHVA